MVIPEFKDFSNGIKHCYEEIVNIKDGHVANYIPELARINPDQLGISICTVDGQQYHIGDVDEHFCVQSCCKPINYLIALKDHGEEKTHKYVGREPSGQAFNELVLNKDGLPHNPLINSGAIMTSSLVGNDMPSGDRFSYVIDFWKQLSGNTDKIGFSNATYLSERDTADRNFALAYFMQETNDEKKVGFPPGTNLIRNLEFYFQCCSIEVNVRLMSIVAATLAHGGVCPLTGEKVIEPEHVRNCLSLMYSCGMYDYSGEFAFRYGIPAKSGVSGCVMMVIPGIMGTCIWSPRLDPIGNSVRGVMFAKQLCQRYNFHCYDGLIRDKNDIQTLRNSEKYDINNELFYMAAVGNLQGIIALHLRKNALDIKDYDRRTLLHVAASEGHKPLCVFLVEKGHVSIDVKDRWNNRPYDDAVREEHGELARYLLSCDQ